MSFQLTRAILNIRCIQFHLPNLITALLSSPLPPKLGANTPDPMGLLGMTTWAKGRRLSIEHDPMSSSNQYFQHFLTWSKMLVFFNYIYINLKSFQLGEDHKAIWKPSIHPNDDNHCLCKMLCTHIQSSCLWTWGETHAWVLTNPDVVEEATKPVEEDASQMENCEYFLNSTENQ